MKNRTKHVAFIAACVIVVVCWTVVKRPFKNLNAGTVASVEITSIMRTDGNMVQLDTEYAIQVMQTLSSIETHLFQDLLNEWKAGSVTHMFTVTLTTGETMNVGVNYPNLVINGTPYRTTLKAQTLLNDLITLYHSHPDHCPCG